MTPDEPLATGVLDAILIDTLLGLDFDPDQLMSLSNEQRLALLQTAAEEGRIPADFRDRLRTLGLLPAEASTSD